jgi:PPK2 family polyphosphate:nucleotide phosphotransferase
VALPPVHRRPSQHYAVPMHTMIDSAPFAVSGEQKVKLSEAPTGVAPFYKGKDDYKKLLEEYQEEIGELQRMMYAHDRHSVLLIFQAMDAAGKDGTITHIMSGVDAHGVTVSAFKRPSDEELEHDFLWRTTKQLPERGRIGIFNRSYYEEVLVVRVHPAILTGSQKLPPELIADREAVWQQRYESIRNFERHLARNGTTVVKFFLHVSRDEQRDRFISRIDEPEKNWKFSEDDVKERAFWDDYQRAYEDAINATAAPHAPWFIVPADDKRNLRLITSQIVLERLRALDLHYPPVSDERRHALQHCREALLKD